VKRVGGRDPVVLRGGTGAKALAVALSRLTLKPQPSVPNRGYRSLHQGGLRLARPWTPCSWPRRSPSKDA